MQHPLSRSERSLRTMLKEFDREKLKKLLPTADVLLIVPPVTPYSYEHPTIGPHVLQSCARAAGFSVTIFYSDLHFLSSMNLEDYQNLCNGDPSLLGENLFASGAHGLPGIRERFDTIYNYPGILGSSWPSFASQFKPFHGADYKFEQQQLIDFESLAGQWIEKTADFVSTLPFKVVGCSASFEQINASFALLQRIKTLKPGTLTLLGGGQCTGGLADGIRSLDPDCKSIDYIFSGESEEAFVSFLHDQAAGKLPGEHIIRGNDCLDLDSIPAPDFSAYFDQLNFFIPDYKEQFTSVSLPYETSRGCWWREKKGCNFCGERRSSYRMKSAQKVYKELEELVEQFHPDGIKMTDVVMPTEYFDTLLPMMAEKEPLNTAISYYLRPDLSLDQMVELKKAGINQLMLGIESLSEGILRKINKGATVRQIIRSLRYTRALSILVQWNILWGIPGDTKDEYQAMLDLLPLIRHLQPPFGFIHLRFDNFSNYANEDELFKDKKLEPMESYKMVFPAHTDFRSLARYFKSDYPAASHTDPPVIMALEKEVGTWFSLWKEGGRMCHLFPGGDGAMLFDTRGLPDLPQAVPLSADQVKTVLTETKYTGSSLQDWALENRLAITLAGHFVPLVTAPPEFLKRFC